MFLRTVYNQWKTFFWIIIIGMGTQLFSMAKGIENAPFFLYHMFSYAHPPKDSFHIILIKTAEGYLDPYELSGRESEMLLNNIAYYNQMKKNGYQDYIEKTVETRFKNKVTFFSYNFLHQGLVNNPANFSKFEGWWNKYFSSVYDKSFDAVSIVSSYVQFNHGYTKSSMDSIIFTCRFK